MDSDSLLALYGADLDAPAECERNIHSIASLQYAQESSKVAVRDYQLYGSLAEAYGFLPSEVRGLTLSEINGFVKYGKEQSAKQRTASRRR